MTIWEIEPPQGFSEELQLTTIGRPSIIRFDTPQSSDHSGSLLEDMRFNNTLEIMTFNNSLEIMEYN